jgi:hypothetical protein
MNFFVFRCGGGPVRLVAVPPPKKTQRAAPQKRKDSLLPGIKKNRFLQKHSPLPPSSEDWRRGLVCAYRVIEYIYLQEKNNTRIGLT